MFGREDVIAVLIKNWRPFDGGIVGDIHLQSLPVNLCGKRFARFNILVTLAPCEASIREVAAPGPDAPPVTIAPTPFNFIDIYPSIDRLSIDRPSIDRAGARPRDRASLALF